MKRLIITVLALVVWAVPALTDFLAGMDAYERKDYATVLCEWRHLAEQGYAMAQTNLGSMDKNGRGVRRDDAEAVKCYRMAAGQRD